MPSRFIAIASSRRKELDTIESSVRVFQITADGLHGPVAYINDVTDPADHRNTKIIFSGGHLWFGAAYDGPLRNYKVECFRDQMNNSGMDLSLHTFREAGRAYICSDDGFYPIKGSIDDTMTVYRSSPIVQEDGMLLPALATITLTKEYENGLEYEIQVEESLPTSLLMAIFSLPYVVQY